MVVSNTTSKVTYTGNGSTGTYAFAFKIFEDADLVVTKVTIATEVEEVLALGTDFTVLGAGDDDGGSVILAAGNLAATHKLVIQRVLSITQEMAYTPSDKFPALTHMEVVDRLTMVAQQLKEELGRCVQVGVGAAAVPDLADVTAAVVAAQLAETNAETAETNAEAAQTAAEAAQGAAESAKTSSETAKTGAETAQGLAETAKTGAETAQGLAETAQGAAEDARDLAQTYAAGLLATSTSSLAIATGTKNFTTQAGKQFAAGQFIIAVDAANSANYMHGQVISYSGTDLSLNVIDVGGTGTIADWKISFSGSRGAIGETGATGTAGLTILSGTGAPSEGLGVDGDYYIDIAAKLIYGPKATTWPAPVTLGGPQGETGPTGPAGSLPLATAGGTVDAITADFTPDLTLTDRVVCLVVCAGANTTTTPTFAPDGLTAHTIVKHGGVALVAGDIGAAGFVAILEYNAANTRWELLNPKTASNLYGTPALPNGTTAATQSASDNSTKLATTAYADAAASGASSGLTHNSGRINPTTPTDNVIIGEGTAVGTSGQKVLALNVGTAPSSSPADMVQLYAEDVTLPEATGGVITRSGGKTIHTFKLADSGTAFVAPTGGLSVDYLVVAGGGGGARGIQAGGGGAGGYRTGTGKTVAAGSYTITVGDGGAEQTGGATKGNNGADSVFSDITSKGGGGGGAYNAGGYQAPGDGGSGGGAGNQGGSNTGGAASPSGQGNAGGAAGNYNSPFKGGGGGGAGAAGATGGDGTSNGGAGESSSISGSAVAYAGGGGGNGQTGTPGAGGSGGGGAGNASGAGTAGTNDLGGGGGSGTSSGGKGGSGVVIISYTTPAAATAELRVRDEAGNVTTLSPHNFKDIPEDVKEQNLKDSDSMAWTYHSEKNGKSITVDMFGAIRALEKFTGKQFIYSRGVTIDKTPGEETLADLKKNKTDIEGLKTEGKTP